MNRPYEPLAQDEAEGLVTPNWADQNQRWLARRFAQLAQCLQAADAPCAGPGSEEPLQRGFEPAHRRLVRLFGLSAFEGELLLLAAGAECDVALRQAIAHAEGLAAAPQAGVSFALALARLPDAHWDAMSPLAPPRAWARRGCASTSGCCTTSPAWRRSTNAWPAWQGCGTPGRQRCTRPPRPKPASLPKPWHAHWPSMPGRWRC
jgi:hypothetical protein